MNTAHAINGEIRSEDWVIVASSGDYSYLVGQVTEITPLGSPEHDTGNATDDVHVNFMALEYSNIRKAELLEAFDHLYPQAEVFDDIPLDDVIMAPESLIRVTGIELEKLLESRETAEAYCDQVIDVLYNENFSQLIERLDANLADYHDSLADLGNRELIGMAKAIAAVSDAHDYLTTIYGFDGDTIEYLLQFKNPLEVVADEVRRRMEDTSDMCFALDEVLGKRDALLKNYALMSDAPARRDLRRYMNVDLIDFLGKIAEKTIIHYPNDWNIDKDELYRAASSHDPEDKRLMWHVCSYSTHIQKERDVFIKDSGAFNYWTNYRQNDADMFGYAVEVTGREGITVKGNVFEVGDYGEHAKYVLQTALPLDTLTLTYSDDWGVNAGKAVTVSRKKYDDDRHRLMCESGNVVSLRWHPANESELTELLRCERSMRMSFPIGSMEAHLKRLTETLAEVRKPITPPIPKQSQSLKDKLHAAEAKAKTQINNSKPHKRAERS